MRSEATPAEPASPSIALGLIVFAVAAVVLAYLCSRVGDWAVMTDELLYERLALAVADGGLPRLHGELSGTPGVLYPLLLSPVFAFASMPGAIVAAHALNGVLFASASVPVYLLARELRVSPFAAVSAAVFSVAVPWSVIAGFVMSEAAAYPAAMWALLAVYRAVVAPSVRRDAVALAAIAVASLARPQLAALGVVLVVAAAAHEARFGRWRAHVVAFGAGAAALVVLLLGGAGLFGTYAPALEEGALVSWDALRSAIVHVDVTAVALGIVPLLLGLGWVVGRFGLGSDVKDRYFFYVAPLLFLATACAFEDTRPRGAALLAVTAFFVVTVGLEDFAPVFGVNLDSPASTIHGSLARWGAPADLLAIVGGLVGVAAFFALRLLPRAPLAYAVLGTLVVVAAAETAYNWNRLLDSSGPSRRAIASTPADEQSWIDAAAGDTTVAMVPYSLGGEWFPSAIAWWDVEFWNASVKRAFRRGPYFAYTPEIFPRPRLGIDPRTGLLSGAADVDYVVRSTLDARFRPAGTAVAAASGLELVALELPRRVAWFTYGLDPDGWTRPDRPAVRVFGPAGATTVRLRLNAPGVRGVTAGTTRVVLQPSQEQELAVEVCV